MMKVRLASEIQPDSILDGSGIRTVIWFQGCLHNCFGCHNPETHDMNGGFLKFAKSIGLNVWAYTGFTYDALINGDKDRLELLKNVDVLVDGKFVLDKKSLACKFRGSTNQRLIDVKKSLEKGDVVLYDV